MRLDLLIIIQPSSMTSMAYQTPALILEERMQLTRIQFTMPARAQRLHDGNIRFIQRQMLTTNLLLIRMEVLPHLVNQIVGHGLKTNRQLLLLTQGLVHVG